MSRDFAQNEHKGARMTLYERIEQASTGLAVTAFAAASSGGLWLVRRIFTNQKQIELLQQALAVRDQRRDEDREALAEVRQDVREMRGEIREILHQK
jgi:L-lactate utilization protein LutB